MTSAVSAMSADLAPRAMAEIEANKGSIIAVTGIMWGMRWLVSKVIAAVLPWLIAWMITELLKRLASMEMSEVAGMINSHRFAQSVPFQASKPE